MGQGQSNAADVSPVRSFPDQSSSQKSDTANVDNTGHESGEKPMGRNTAPYDHLDALQEQLPTLIDEESRQQVDDYIQACDKGRGPMVACFAMGEYIGMFERKHEEAFKLFENTCFRPKTDKSPNGKEVDGTKAYGPGCFNYAKMLMTGKGGEFDEKKAYDAFDRACQAGHGGACFIQAKMLLSPPGSFGDKVPYDPSKSMDLYQKVCDTGDSVACFTLATMLLRGDKISMGATNATPAEAKGEVPVAKRTNEDDRSRSVEKEVGYITRDPKRAESLLLYGCETGSHAPSCFNLAVMYDNGDDGIPQDSAKAEEFKTKTEKIINTFGGFGKQY